MSKMRKQNKRYRVFAIVILLIFSCTIDSLSVPFSWTIPDDRDIGNDDWRKDDPGKYLIVKGDFNGDGIGDVAKLLISPAEPKFGLFAFIAAKDQMAKMYKLVEVYNLESIHLIGIRKVSPGRYKTACGKGYWPCANDELPEISLQNDAIEYFKYESASSFFYWDSKENAFKEIAISD